MDDSEFDIRIKDNFLSKKDFEIISNIGNKINFNSNDLTYTGKTNHVWFTANAPQIVIDIIKKNVSKFFNFEILKLSVCQYSMVSKSQKVEAHNDSDDKNDFQTILYVKGNKHIHSGTGFYIQEGNKHILNTHVGFKPNRIVSWTPNVYHAPLSFTDEYQPRISLITQYKLK